MYAVIRYSHNKSRGEKQLKSIHKVIYEDGKIKELFLVEKNRVQEHIHYFNWAQNKLNRFENISVKPYNGKKYNQNIFCWIVIG